MNRPENSLCYNILGLFFDLHEFLNIFFRNGKYIHTSLEARQSNEFKYCCILHVRPSAH